MSALLPRSAPGSCAPLRQKLVWLGFTDEFDLNVILSKIRIEPCVHRGDDILPFGSSGKHLTVLISGVACLYERLPDGNRQIFAFQYPGDFCDLNRHVMHKSAQEIAVAAITECSTGSIENAVLEELIVRFPLLGLALWRSTVLEATALRESLLSRRHTALQHVAHLLCEQLARRAVIGIDDPSIPVSQVDLADAAGLSVVHINRTFKDLQWMGLLSKAGRSMKVVDREKLARLAGFDGSYLDMPRMLSGWHVKL